MSNKAYQENFFTYQGVNYGVGTQVMLRNEVYKQYYSPASQQDGDIFTFSYGFSDDYKVFSRQGRGNIVIRNPDQEISKIVYPVIVTTTTATWQQQAFDNMVNQKVNADVFGGVLLYIIVMLVGAIFYDRWIIWIFSTLIFVYWLLKQYRT